MRSEKRDGGGALERPLAEHSRVLAELERSLPVDDLLAWLLGALPGADRDQLFAALKAVYEAGFEIVPASRIPKPYAIGRDRLRACPQRVTVRRAR